MLIRIAPLLFVLLWSSSFIAVKAGLLHLSPLLFVAVRLVACAVALGCLVFFWRLLGRRGCRLSVSETVHCAVAGVLLQAGGLMGPHVGMLMAPSAQIALVQSLTPLLTSVLGIMLLREGLRPMQWSGVTLGLVGVGLVVGQAALHSPAEFNGLALAFAGVLGLVSGTLYFGRFCRGIPLLAGSVVQFTAAAVIAVLTAWLLETPRWDLSAVAVASVAWNTVLVSLGGMALYAMMLARGTAARAAANFYLVPGTAGVLGWLFLGERLSPLTLTGLAVAGIGCCLVAATERRSGQART